jgi:hypothetical protein
MGKFAQGRRRSVPLVSFPRVLTYLAVGFIVGGVFGYFFMATTHAVLETRGIAHLAVTTEQQQKQPQPQQQQKEERQPQQGEQADHNAEAKKQTHHQQFGKTSSSNGNDDTIHTLATSNGSPYQNIQMRIAYATYQLVQAQPGGDRMVGFTRILHRSKPDILMDEIPTFRADPLHPNCDEWCEYPVSDRGDAAVQFFKAAAEDPSMIKAPWIYMIESDYVFMRPLAVPDPSARNFAWGFFFKYISPGTFPELMRRFPRAENLPIVDIPRSGPAPILMHKDSWERVS